MRPFLVAAIQPLGWWWRIPLIAFEPAFQSIVIELFRPEHACEALPHHVLRVLREVLRNYGAVKLVSFTLSNRKYFVEFTEGRLSNAGEVNISKPQTNRHTSAGGNFEFVVGGGFGPVSFRIYCIVSPIHDVVVNSIFDVRRRVFGFKQAFAICFVLGEELLRRSVAIEPPFP